MGLKIVWLLAVQLILCLGQEDPDDFLIQELYGSEESNCKCKPADQCTNVIQTDGADLVDPRGSVKVCELGQVCCEDTEDKKTPNPISGQKTSKGCGIRQPTGVGSRIVGPEENDAEFGEFPWMILIMKVQTFRNGTAKFVRKCGGSLIHEQVVMTAAHCVHRGVIRNQDKVVNFKVRAGEWDMESTEDFLPHQEERVVDIIKHENFYEGGLLNDIALLVLEKPFNYSEHIDIICLPKQDYFFLHDDCLATGWGKSAFEKNGTFQKILKKVQLPLVSKPICENKLRETALGTQFSLHPSFICAGGEVGRDTCQGDGGGPLICPILGSNPKIYQQIGIVAGGVNCGLSYPGLYANVAHFRNWINEKLDKLGYTGTKRFQNFGAGILEEKFGD